MLIGSQTGEQTTDAVEVYAMCAIDALGIAAMLNEDVWIGSTDVTTGRLVTVVVPAPGSGRATTWNPDTAVAFVGADDCGGPSADCCCDHLNLFVDETAAEAWSAQHPSLAGEILIQADAEELGVRLFSSLPTS